ncbi:MAG: sodium:proton antiporter [Rhodospirillales bacterium]|jgi:multicomponent Na+:H+ antiporter subunit B|nr:sodium:proton antiporter [Rhodospirillales bacterium]
MRQILTPIVLVLLGAILWQAIPFSAPADISEIGRRFVEFGVADNRAANIVTSVIVNYRGLDTLGEVSVLFLSVTGAVFVLRRREGLTLAKPTPSSELVATGARLLFGPILLFGAYIFAHGHLTPGGGFQGGAIVASSVLLLLLADRDRALAHNALGWIESMSGFLYVVVGMVGIAIAGSFLSNKGILPLGLWNDLFSAGLIPIIYVLVGLKVGSELASLIDAMMHSGEPETEVGGTQA